MPSQSRTPPSGYESPDEEHPPPGPSTGRNFVFDPEHAMTTSVNSVGLAGLGGLDGVMAKAEGFNGSRKVGLRDRIGCYQWTWFTMTMATGGVANVLYTLPYESAFLTVLGTIFCILNLVLFVTNCTLLTLRFRFRPGSFLKSFTDQMESLFISAFFVSIATIIVNICEYGVPHCGDWLLVTMEVVFWIQLAMSTLASAGLYLTLWSTQIFPLHTMTPIWVFPAYPLLLSAPMAGSLINAAILTNRIGSINAVPVAVAGLTVQGTGFFISFMICAAFLYRLMTQKLPRDAQRPGVFISIGPSGFTAGGIIALGTKAGAYLPNNFMGTEYAVPILRVLSIAMGLCLWGLSVWFFLVSVGSLWKYCKPTKSMPFSMTFFSFVFPNTALVTATIQIGKALGSTAINTVGTVFAGCVVIVWGVVFGAMIRSLWTRQLLWPKDD